MCRQLFATQGIRWMLDSSIFISKNVVMMDCSVFGDVYIDVCSILGGFLCRSERRERVM